MELYEYKICWQNVRGKNAIKMNSYKKEKKAISNICPMAKLNFATKKECCKFILRIHAQLY